MLPPSCSSARLPQAQSESSSWRWLRSAHGEVPIVLGGIAAGGDVPHDHHGMRVVERIDESVEAVEGVLAARATVASR
jgi:hypothetical protein